MKKLNFGEFIKNTREEKNFGIEFCSSSLKIHKKYLVAIEENNYQVFDNYFQAQGFVQNYLEFLELKPIEYMPRWRGDFYTDFSHFDEKQEKFYKPKKTRILNFTISLSKLLYGFAAIIVISFLGYIGYQYNETLSSPKLEIFKPQTNEIFEEDLVDIFGKTESDSVLKINNEKITLATDGNFSTSLKLAEGINTLKFTATNPYGKETVRILHLIFRPRKIEVYNPPVEEVLKGNTQTQPMDNIIKIKESEKTEPSNKISEPSTKNLTKPSIKQN
jgi:cytoskeletal protein RodZ